MDRTIACGNIAVKMFEDFYHEEKGGVCISADQASRFAKDVAGDFNPIHNPDARRFCVPGDLLFALVLARFGLYQRMAFRFNSMVNDKTVLRFKEDGPGRITVEDVAGKVCLEAVCEGEVTRDEAVVEAFVRRYVAFSGLNFPHYLKPLFEEKGVMFNPQRPMVIYDSMGFALDELPAKEPEVEFAGGTLDVEGKRATVRFQFQMKAGDAIVGTGSKKLIVSGLLAYDAQVMDDTITEFFRLKSVYEGQRATRA